MRTHHTRLALRPPTRHADFLVYIDHIVDQCTNNAHLPNIALLVATMKTDHAALRAAETTARSHAPGAADDRNHLLQKVVLDLHQVAAHVQSVADATPADAHVIIASAGFGTHVHGVHALPEIAAHMLPGGLVHLSCHSTHKSGTSYEWGYSADGGKTFTALPSTGHAHATAPGLTAGQSYVFRVRANVRGATGDWHETPFLVH